MDFPSGKSVAYLISGTRREKNMIHRIHSLIPVTTLIGSILLAYLLDRYFFVIEIIPAPFHYIGWGMIAAGFIFAAYCVAQLVSKRTTPDPGGIPSVLLKEGPYSFSRNPIYLADLIIATGAAIVLSSLAAFIAPVIFFLIVNSFVIPFEEIMLQKTFGQEYEKYQREVRRWF
jgi:protein-S-isoprenylcysteine O-methyltransferase Ste14